MSICQPSPALSQPFQLRSGDRICLIGNTLAERMQHDGWLETMIQARFPGRQLVFRNLGFSADELTTRLRSKDFGSPDQWLMKCQADVVFAFFGYNESFGRQPGLEGFQKDLESFVTHTLKQNYNGETPPRLVLFTPPAHENLDNPDLPDGVENNRWLKRYAEIVKSVGEKHNVTVVDLFELFQQTLFPSDIPDGPLTINGIHLTETGNYHLGLHVVSELFGEWDDASNLKTRLQPLRRAVQDKNWHWFHRYRTTDGFSTYGGRADLKFTNGQTNREVVQRELEVLDFMTAERDKKIWAMAQGEDYEIDDSQAPPFIPVITNKPGSLPGGKHAFLSGEAAIEKMDVHPNMQVNLFASEEQWPELASPVQMAFDPKGRLWVAAWPTYPHWQPIVEQMNDKLLIFEDDDGDGRADSMKVFADQLHNPTGFEFWNGGVLVAQAPDIWFLQDTDGDDQADLRLRVLHGIDSADTHHTANSFVYGPGGAIYFQEGTFHHTQVETPWGPPVRSVNAGVFRFEPRTYKFEVYVAYPFANPHGHVFNYWGQDFVTDGTGNVNYFAAPFSGYIEYPNKHRNYFPFFQQWVRPAGATEILSSKHFPQEFQGNYLIANVIGFQGLLRYRVNEEGSGYSAEEVTPIVRSTDPNFRPVDIEMGPDGAIYFVDWQNPIIGHMQHNLRDPNRDKEHGRVYRVTYEDRPLSESIDMAAASIPELLDQLKSPEDRVRYRARLELSGRNTDEVLAARATWVEALNEEDADYQHHLLEALWLSQQHNRVDKPLLRRMLVSPEPRARAAATRVLCYCRDQVPDALNRLSSLVNDPFPRVRLEAVRSCSFFREARAAEIALQALNHPMDKFLDYSLRETMRSLETFWKAEIAASRPFAVDNEAGLRYIMRGLSSAELSKMVRNRVVYEQLLAREGILHDLRHEAAMGLAELNGTDPGAELLTAIERLDQSDEAGAQSVLADLAHIFLMHDPGPDMQGHAGHSSPDFSKYREKLDQLAEHARRAVTREIAFATLMKAEQSSARVWQMALKSPHRFRDLINGVPLIDNRDLKQELQPKISELLHRLPMSLDRLIDQQPSTVGQFVRVELPGPKRTLTLAEVEVFSDGRNVAPAGKATQSGTSHGGQPERAVDGNTSGVYSDGGQTHTPENRPDPWWELNLGSAQPLDSIRIWNRTDGSLGNRLEGFTIKVLDADRQVVFEQSGIAAPKAQETFQLQGDPRGAIVRAAINASVHVSGSLPETFQRLADFVLNHEHRSDAVRALSRLPRRSWVDEKIQPLVADIIARVSALPAAERTQPVVLDEIALGKKLAAALPVDVARQARDELNDLGINVIVLRPIPHRMQYDRNQFFVEAGKPFQIVFENTDIMPHNIVIARPGSYAKVGIASEVMATQPDAIQRQFVPDLPEVMHASRMLQPSQIERLDLVAPSEEGEYPYLCTFPGHWRRMYGSMFVVKDLDEVPIEALAPSVDPEIATRPFVREWKVDDLVDELTSAANQRQFERGQSLFTELSCAQCHKIGSSDGGEVGPNLLDLQEKFAKGEMKRVDLLRELIEPSHKIEDKFKTWIIQDIDGRVYTGVIAERTDESIRLLANPLDKGEPVTIAIDDIEEEIESKISMMPIGLLNTCDKDEVLDLLMFIESAAEPSHPAFSK